MAGRAKQFCLTLVVAVTASAAFAARMDPAAVNNAEPPAKMISKDRPTPFGVRLEVLLDRAHFSPGEIDGKFGTNARKALRAYLEAQHLPASDNVSEDAWKKLRTDD